MKNKLQIGLGTWQIGLDPNKEISEIDCFLEAINNYNITIIDTAEMYEGAEELVGKVIKKCNRKKLFIIDKILPKNIIKGKVENHCRISLEKTNCDYFDLYLLHWRENVNLELMIEEMENLKEKGLIKEWGVSNFDVCDMEDLLKYKNGNKCFANQILYNIFERGIEYDLLPYLKEKNILPIIYSPLGNIKESQKILKNNEKIVKICENNNISITNLMMRFVTKNKELMVIFKTSKKEHLKETIYEIEKGLSKKEFLIIDKEFPAPIKKIPLQKI